MGPALRRGRRDMSSLVESYGLMAAGHEALRRGDATAACDHFDRAARAAPTDVEAWLGLALASRELKDGAKAAAATDRALALAPRSFRALMVRADLYAEDGHARAASSFYAAALRNAPVGAQHSPSKCAKWAARTRCATTTRARTKPIWSRR